MTLNTQPYKGARDFYPEDKRVQKYMFGVMRSVVERFGYEEYDAPIVESLDTMRPYFKPIPSTELWEAAKANIVAPIIWQSFQERGYFTDMVDRKFFVMINDK